MYKKVQRSTGSEAVNMLISVDSTWLFDEMRIHLSDVGGSGTLTVTLESEESSVYDTLIFSEDMTAVKDIVYQPSRLQAFAKNDALKIEWENSNSVTYGIEVNYSKT